MENRLREKIDGLIEEIHNLENRIEKSFTEAQKLLHFQIIKNRVKFEKETIRFHKTFKTGVFRYMISGDLAVYLSAPFIYVMIFPAIALDFFVSLFQAICFPVYRIPKVQRRDYIAIDRHKLGYLNAIERMNCMYCAYFNGLIAYVREIAARTEQYWCPIRHSRRIKGSHDKYQRFSPYGDAESYHGQLEQLRDQLRNLEKKTLQ